MCCGPRVPRVPRYCVWLPDSERLPPVCSPAATFSRQPTARHARVLLGGSFCKHESPHQAYEVTHLGMERGCSRAP